MILLLLKYKYLILFPLAVVEGPVVALIAGALVALGYFDFFLAYTVLLLGDFVPDTFFYILGRYWGNKDFINRYGSKFGLTEKRFSVIQRLFHTHGFKTMLVSKFAYGMAPAFLISAGIAKIPVKNFYVYIVSITTVTYGILMGLGFYFGSSYLLFSAYLKDIGIVISVSIVVLIVGYYIFTRFIKEKFVKY